jgi:hypothetical protein
MTYFDPGQSRLMSQERDLIAKHLRISNLYQQRWESLEVAKKRAGVWVGQILLHVFTEIQSNGIHVVVLGRERYDIESGIGFP